MSQVNLRNLPFYWLNVDSRPDRALHMQAQLHGFINDRVDGSPSPLLQRIDDGRQHFVGAPLGHARVIDYAVRRMGATFEPFVLCEDDIAWTVPPGPEPIVVDYPPDADAIYLGISACGTQPAVHDYHMEIVREQSATHPHLQRVYNMLTAHAVLFLSFRYTMAYFAAMIESCASRQPCDCISTRLSATHQVYALGEPIFYQHGAVGGQETMTKIAWQDKGTPEAASRGRNYNKIHPYSTLLGPPVDGITTVALPLCIEDVKDWQRAKVEKLVLCIDRMRHPRVYELVKDVMPKVPVLLTDELDPRELVSLARRVNHFNTRAWCFTRGPSAVPAVKTEAT